MPHALAISKRIDTPPSCRQPTTYLEDGLLHPARQLTTGCQIHPLTMTKAYQDLAGAGLTEQLHAEGLVVRQGVREVMLRRGRSRILGEEWPLQRALEVARHRHQHLGAGSRSIEVRRESQERAP
jgi:DNA-binding transcriptional regulator YhcF (GntR family)